MGGQRPLVRVCRCIELRQLRQRACSGIEPFLHGKHRLSRHDHVGRRTSLPECRQQRRGDRLARGSDEASEGDWAWVTGPETGQAFTYTNWAPGEPNNVTSTGEQYLLGWWSGDQWNDIYNGYASYGIVVEYNASVSPVPLPAALPLMFGALGALGLFARRRKAA